MMIHSTTTILLLSVAVLGGTGLLAAAVLWLVARRFHVDEDPRIGRIEGLLPGANCGGCGKSGCHAFAAACVEAPTLEGLNCPGSAAGTMTEIALITGKTAASGTGPRVAVVACNGSCTARRRAARFDGPRSCAVAASLGAGESACAYGCLGCGDCVAACRWGAIAIDGATGLPVVDDTLCTGCGACVKACPRSIIALRGKGRRDMRVWVACSNRDRGALAAKECKVACLGCGKCERECPFGAITVTDNLAVIDGEKCRLCRKCVAVCPTHAILTANFPVKQQP